MHSEMVTSDLINVELIDKSIAKLHEGKAQGHDHLQAEHLTHAHPILYVILSKLFYCMLRLGYVPDDFGRGLLVPIQKDSSKRGVLSVEHFRGITISPVISKVFEHCILTVYKDYMYSSDRQFGFKKDISCAHSIFTVRKVIDYFVENDSTVNICCLDISKAFDRVNHYGLFVKLMKRGAPVSLLLVLQNWYSKCVCRIRWGNFLSSEFSLKAGVRQGGVLSPILFLIYVDNILNKLDHSGCKMHGLNLGSFMYADDLILIAPSLTELQNMIDICCNELCKIDLVLNETKSVCIRIGKRWHCKCNPLKTRNGLIAWSDAAMYLGVNIKSAAKFTCCFDKAKSNFYSSFNAIYSKLGKINNQIVTLNLISSIALPCLLFAVEALPLSKSVIKSIEHPWSRVFMKIFMTFDAKTVTGCQYFTGFMPIAHIANSRKIKFINQMKASKYWLLRSLHELVAVRELDPIASFYGVDMHFLCTYYVNIIKSYFEGTVES
jgi:Reverse transcriptase (RNA-dependent DNA polymerase)